MSTDERTDMQTVTMSREVLRTHLETNRALHAKNFAEALAGFHTLLEKRLTKMVKLADQSRAKAQLPDAGAFWLGLEWPENHLDDYDRVLAMLDVSVGDTVTLSSVDFDRYVRDRWEWAEKFASTTAVYNAVVPKRARKR